MAEIIVLGLWDDDIQGRAGARVRDVETAVMITVHPLAESHFGAPRSHAIGLLPR